MIAAEGWALTYPVLYTKLRAKKELQALLGHYLATSSAVVGTTGHMGLGRHLDYVVNRHFGDRESN